MTKGRKPLSVEEVIRRVEDKQPSCKVLSVVRGEGTMMLTGRITRRCLQCYWIWDASVGNVLGKNTGCPRCADRLNAHNRAFRNLRCDIPGVLYRVDSKYGSYSKVGFTQNLRKRLTDMESRVPFLLGSRIHVLFEGQATVACELEYRLVSSVESAKFSGFDGSGEWLLSESLDKIVLDEYIQEVYNRAPARYLI